MKLSSILSDLNIEYRCIGERDFSSLGLIEYNNGKSVCTFAVDSRYLSNILPSVTMVLTNGSIAVDKENAKYGICIVENPRLAFFKVHNFLTDSEIYCRTHFESTAGKDCKISDSARIAEKNVTIGNNVTIEEFCVIKENTVIGDNCIVRSGAIIGSEGFEFKKDEEAILGVKHAGGVVLEKNVEVQCNTVIDKAIYPWDNTVIGEYSKIDNFVHIAHGVKIGKRVMVVAHSAIGGRVEVDDDAWIGIGALIRNGIKIGKRCRVNMGAVVTKNVEDDDSVTGNFAINHGIFISNLKKLV